MKPNDDPGLLTDRQQRFACEYLKDQNASAAARRCGYAESNCRSQGAELLRNPAVKARIREEFAALFAELKVSVFSLLRERARAAFFDPGKLFDEEGKPVPLHELDPDTRAALQIAYSRRSNGEYVVRVRQPSRAPALAALEKRYAQFLELTVVPEEPAGLRDRAREFDEQTVRLKKQWTTYIPPEPTPAPQAQSVVPEPGARPAEPGPSLTQRAVGAVKQLVKGLEPAVKPVAAKPIAPAKRAAKSKHGKYWVNLNGQVDLTHPDVPANVRQRLEDQKREREEWQARRDNRRWLPDLREGGPRPDDARPKFALTGPVFGD